MIILLNGSINSGKSTIAKLLVEKIPNSVNLEVDKQFEFVDHLENIDVEQIVWENVFSLAQDYRKHGLNVIISYVFGEGKATQLMNELAPIDNKIFLFTLSPNISTALHNRGQRKLTDSDRERIKVHYNQGIHSPTIGIKIDNSSQSPEETTQLILKNVSGFKAVLQ